MLAWVFCSWFYAHCVCIYLTSNTISLLDICDSIVTGTCAISFIKRRRGIPPTMNWWLINQGSFKQLNDVAWWSIFYYCDNKIFAIAFTSQIINHRVIFFYKELRPFEVNKAWFLLINWWLNTSRSSESKKLHVNLMLSTVTYMLFMVQRIDFSFDHQYESVRVIYTCLWLV